MICPNCGKQLPDFSRFCDDCGAPLGAAPQAAAPAYAAAPSPAPVSPAPKKKNRWVLPVILAVVLLAAAAVFLLWFFGDGRAYNQAQALYEKGEYTQAENAFRSLGDYKDSTDRVNDCRYRQALAAYDKGNYALAKAQFESLGAYKDSAEQVKACRYQLALQAFDKGDTEAAAEAFEALGDYKDSADWLLKCRPSMVGTWELTAMTSDGEDYYATLKEYGITVVLQLNEDGTGYLDVGGEKDDITWSGNSITIDGEKEYVKLNGNTLIIEETDAVMTFTRR